MPLHLSENSHQSKHDFSLTGLGDSFSQLVQIPMSSSLQISTFPPQNGHGKNSGTGRMNFDIPGHVTGLLSLISFLHLPQRFELLGVAGFLITNTTVIKGNLKSSLSWV